MPSRDELVEAWGDHVLGRLRPKAKALFQAGRFVSVEGEQAKFGLPNETHRKRCEEVRADVEAVLSEHFGRRVSLVLVVDDSTGGQAAPTGRSGPGAPDSFVPSSGSSDSSPSAPAAPPSGSSFPSGDSAPAARGSAPPAGAAAAMPFPTPPGSPAVASGSRAPSAPTDRSAPSAPADRSAPVEDDDDQDFSAFDESELGEVADVDNSPAARVLQAFPGAEEVN